MPKKKLIEVDMPLGEINDESRREKSIRHGHPSTLHLWWARRPLASCRAVIFASMVDDPSECQDEFPTVEEQDAERRRLHDLMREMVKWERTDEGTLESLEIQNNARYEIARSVARLYNERPPSRDNADAIRAYLNEKAPQVHDPFAGGGSIPLEAQRLGLRVSAADLNPVAVLINKALVELTPRFAGRPPINPGASKYDRLSWRGAAGLADDIRYYGRMMRDAAFECVGHIYPKAVLPDGKKTTVIAWLWARTVPCPNPACGIKMPLLATFRLSTKNGNEHWIRPIVGKKSISFVVQNNDANVPKVGTIHQKNVTCLACNTSSKLSYVREQSKAGNIGEQMTAIVAEGERRRLFLSVTEEHVRAALSAKPDEDYIPQQKMPITPSLISGRGYGVTHWHELFSPRQLAIHASLSQSLDKVCKQAMQDGADAEYADVIRTYLALAIGRNVDSCSRYNRWQNTGDFVAGVFSRQAIAMIWDFAEANPFSNSTQNWLGNVEWVAKVVGRLPANVNAGHARQADASTTRIKNNSIIITDPPYYDNISYAELSDYFYVWLRPLLRDTYPDLFPSISAPLDEEMIAAPRFKNADKRFEKLMNNTLAIIRKHSNPEFPVPIFYAYKQQEKEQDGTTSTGWDTMLSALVHAGFQIEGTWPMRTERSARSNALKTNALASSIILVCRIRPPDAPVVARREFVNALRTELTGALHYMRAGNIVPVDLAQASIGPGMSVFTRYAKVLNTDGDALSVRDALILINQTLDEILVEEEGDFDADTRWALAWFEQYRFGDGSFGLAETLSKAKNTSVQGMIDAGILASDAGKVRLLRPVELPKDWDPKKDKRFTIWEAAHHMIRVLEDGESAAAGLMARLGADAASARELAYRLYHMCEQKRYVQEAQDYNALVQSWPEISRLSRETILASTSEGMRAYDNR